MPDSKEKLRIGDWVLNPRTQLLSRGDAELQLNVKMFELLMCLCSKPGETVTRDEVIDTVWKGNRFVGQRGLTNVIWQLRQHLGADAIVTVAKVGYRLDLPVEYEKAKALPTAWKAWLVIALLFAGLVVWDYLRTGLSAPPMAQTPEYGQSSLTFYNGVEEFPAFSADGRYLAFTWEQANLGSRLFIRDLVDEGAPIRQVSMSDDDEAAPTWGPGGREIAFVRVGKDGSCKVMVRSLLTMAERFIDECAYERYHRILDWSRDGRHLYYAKHGPEAGVISIYQHELSSGHVRRVSWPNAGQEDKQIAVSPDGQVAFVRSAAATADVHVIAVDGSVRQVTRTHEPVYGIAWLDDKNLVVNILRDGRFALWKLDTVTAETQLLHRAETPFNIAVLPDGSGRVAFSLHRGMEYIETIDPMTGATIAEFASTGRDMYGNHSPTGNRVVFVSTRSGSFELWVAGVDGTSPRKYPNGVGMPDLPAWSPDGEHFVAPVFDNHGRYQVMLFDAGTGVVTQLTNDHDFRNVNWFGSENALLVSSDRGGEWDLWRLSIEDGSYRRLTDDGGTYGQVFGDFLYYTRSGVSGIWRKPLNGGGSERVMNELHRDDWGSWQVTSHGLYHVAREAKADKVMLRDIDTGESRTIARYEKGSIRIYRSLNVREPDRLVLTRLGNRQADIILLTPQT